MFKTKELREKMEKSKIMADAALVMLEQLNSEDPEKREAALFYIKTSLKDISKNLKDS